MLIRTTSCLILMALAAVASGEGEVPRESEEDVRVWRVGVERQLPPVAFVDGRRVRGLAVEMIEAVAEFQGHTIELRTAETAELRRALEAGEIDVIPHMPISDALESRFGLTLPHWVTEDAIFINKSAQAPACPLRRQAASGPERVIVLEDDPGWEWVMEQGHETLVRPSVLEALFALHAGEAGCAVLPKDSTAILIERLGYGKDEIQQLPGRLKAYDRSLAFAVRQGDDELQAILEEGLIVVTATDQFGAIYNRWDNWRGDVEWPRWLAWALAPLGFLLIWTWSLRRTVARRTAELQAEMVERQRLETRVQQSRKMESLGVLAGGIAHDFNNLLMGVLGNASLAMHQVPEDSPVRPRLDEIRRAGRRAADLCGQMLAYSGKGRFVLEPVNLVELLLEKEAAVAALLLDGTHLEVAYEQDLPELRGDRNQLMQMLTQLMANASESFDEDGTGEGRRTVKISAYLQEVTEPFESPHLGELCAPGFYVALTVDDNGAGMDDETLGRIFEPFFSTKFTGRGLGLAAVLGIVRAHQGAIDVTSSLGQGTSVRVLLPALGEPSTQPSPAPVGAADKMAVHAQDL